MEIFHFCIQYLFPSFERKSSKTKRNGMTTNTFCRFAIPISSWGNFCHFSCPHFVSTTIGMEALNCQEEKSLSTHSDYGKNESVNCQAAEEQRRRTTAKCQEWNYANYLHLGAVRDSRSKLYYQQGCKQPNLYGTLQGARIWPQKKLQHIICPLNAFACQWACNNNVWKEKRVVECPSST